MSGKTSFLFDSLTQPSPPRGNDPPSPADTPCLAEDANAQVLTQAPGHREKPVLKSERLKSPPCGAELSERILLSTGLKDSFKIHLQCLGCLFFFFKNIIVTGLENFHSLSRTISSPMCYI